VDGKTSLEINYRPGLKALFARLFVWRFEIKKFFFEILVFEDHEIIITALNKLGGPKRSTVKRHAQFHIFTYHVFKQYRGWCYIRGLPIHGQRTWTNAWSACRCNVLMKPLILKRAKDFYGNLPNKEMYTAYMAEFVNRAWRTFWHRDWAAARANRLKHKKNRRLRHKIRVDLYSMARGHILTDKRVNKLTKKQKAQHNLFHISLGYAIGFSRGILKNLYKMKAFVPNAKKKTHQ